MSAFKRVYINLATNNRLLCMWQQGYLSTNDQRCDCMTVEAIDETYYVYECRTFGRKFTAYLQLSRADDKSVNMTEVNICAT